MSGTEQFFIARSSLRKWYAAVPILTNPVLSVEVITVIALILPISACFILLVQFVMEGGIAPAQIAFAFSIGGSLSGVALFSYLFIGGLLLKNRYTAYYELTDTHISNDIMRCEEKVTCRHLFSLRAWPIKPPQAVGKVVNKKIALHEIKKIKVISSVNLIMISTGNGSGFMKIYCTDSAMCEKVRQHLFHTSALQAKG